MTIADGSSGGLTSPKLGRELEFLGLLWELDHALHRRSKRMQASLGATAPQRLVLRIVGRRPGIPAGELAALLRLHPSTLTGILKRLERRGWLKRRPDPRDGRRTLLGLTERGRAIDAAPVGTLEEAVSSLFAAVPPEDVEAARRVFVELSRRLAADTAGARIETPARR
jgi:DNA-binding MarR family transcriptional regulator